VCCTVSCSRCRWLSRTNLGYVLRTPYSVVSRRRSIEKARSAAVTSFASCHERAHLAWLLTWYPYAWVRNAPKLRGCMTQSFKRVNSYLRNEESSSVKIVMYNSWYNTERQVKGRKSRRHRKYWGEAWWGKPNQSSPETKEAFKRRLLTTLIRRLPLVQLYVPGTYRYRRVLVPVGCCCRFFNLKFGKWRNGGDLKSAQKYIYCIAYYKYLAFLNQSTGVSSDGRGLPAALIILPSRTLRFFLQAGRGH
jgi:hypothetical protein